MRKPRGTSRTGAMITNRPTAGKATVSEKPQERRARLKAEDERLYMKQLEDGFRLLEDLFSQRSPEEAKRIKDAHAKAMRAEELARKQRERERKELWQRERKKLLSEERREQVATAIFDKAVQLNELGHYDEALAVYDEIVDRFGTASEPALREQVAKAREQKEILLRKLDESNSQHLAVNKLDLDYNAPAIPARARETETPATLEGRQEDEGLVKEPHRKILYVKLDSLLKSEGFAEDVRPAKIVEIAHIIAPQISEGLKWGNRSDSYDLSIQTGPRFLKAVHSDCIYKGHVYKETIRGYDPELMKAVELYISTREKRGLDLGDAEGLVFVTSKAATNKVDREPTKPETPPKRKQARRAEP